MPNDLPIPPELQHLIEKRERAEQRERLRRITADRRICDLGPLDAIEFLSDMDGLPLEDRRSQKNRRTVFRRKLNRRKRYD